MNPLPMPPPGEAAHTWALVVCTETHVGGVLSTTVKEKSQPGSAVGLSDMSLSWQTTVRPGSGPAREGKCCFLKVEFQKRKSKLLAAMASHKIKVDSENIQCIVQNLICYAFEMRSEG